jgi:hypothetical protein
MSIPGCVCEACRNEITLTLSDTEQSIENACDVLYHALLEYYRVRSQESLSNLVRAAQLVETLHFKPVLIIRRRAVQITNNKASWVDIVPSKEETFCPPTS